MKEILFLRRIFLIKQEKNLNNKELTVTISVDSALATNTKTSASKQCLSIHSSKLGVTSTPGESTKTTSSLNNRQRVFGQKTLTNWDSFNFSLHNACANCPTDSTAKCSFDPSRIK